MDEVLYFLTEFVFLTVVASNGEDLSVVYGDRDDIGDFNSRGITVFVQILVAF